MHLATKTLAAIDAAMRSDQGAKFRHYLREAMPHAEDAYSEEESDFRAHLGASVIGRECPREVWYSFHWTTLRKHSGQLLRLFNRGHLEEPRMVALLRMIGCTVYQFDADGNQFRITGHKGHYGGSLDSVVVGCPDIPDHPILGEYKTHNDKSFQKLKVEGVIASKWEHFVQMQQYMGKMQLCASLYMATNKNDDEIHAELIQFDPAQYQRYEQRSVQIIDAREPPPKISDTPGFWKCKFCDHRDVCHLKALPARNCRTCVHSLPGDDGIWWCNNKERQLELLFPAQNPEREDFTLTKTRQLKGCEHYEMNPSIKS